jgi:hypothetical protein
MRILLALVPLALAACTSTAGFDFIEAHGTMADGTAIDGHKPANVARVPSLMPAVGTVLAVGAAFDGPEDLKGFRIEWVESAIGAGASFASDPNGPVLFYVDRVKADAGANDEEASIVNGGTITFTGVGSKITGTLANLVLSRNGQTIVTVASGSFQATRP